MPTYPVPQRRLELSQPRQNQSGVAADSCPHDLTAPRRESVLFGDRKQVQYIISRIGARLQRWRRLASLAERDRRSHTKDFLHLLATWALRARDESEIGERAADRRRLGILETSDRIDVAVPLALAGPTGRGRSRIGGITIDECLERDRAVDVRDQLCIDTTLRIARIKHFYTLGD